MKFTVIFSAIVAFAMMASCSHADIITNVTSAEGFVSGAGGAQTLTSITANGETRNLLTFATLKSGAVGFAGNLLSGVGSTAPATNLATLTDDRFDTGGLSNGGAASFGQSFTFAHTFSTTDQVFLIFNGNEDNFPATAEVYDSAGTQLGSTANFTIGTGSSFGTLDLDRGGTSTLGNRRLYGVAVDVVDFGLSDAQLAQVTNVAFGSPNGTDYNLAGVASVVAVPVPEPGSAGFLGLCVVALAGMRRRRK